MWPCFHDDEIPNIQIIHTTWRAGAGAVDTHFMSLHSIKKGIFDSVKVRSCLKKSGARITIAFNRGKRASMEAIVG